MATKIFDKKYNKIFPLLTIMNCSTFLTFSNLPNLLAINVNTTTPIKIKSELKGN